MAATTSTTITKNNRSSQVGMNNTNKKPLSIGQFLDTFKVTRGQPHTHTAFGDQVKGVFYVPPKATHKIENSVGFPAMRKKIRTQLSPTD